MKSCGIDPSRSNFAVSYVEDMREFDYQEYENSFSGFNEFLRNIKKFSPDLRICIEGYGDQAKMLSLFLKEHSFKVFEVSPYQNARIKEGITEDKTDHIDSFSCALFPFFRTDMKELSLDKNLEGLKNMTRAYGKLEKHVVQLKNQLHAALNQNYGILYKKFFPAISETSLNFFIEYPSLKSLSEAGVDEIYEVLKKGRSNMYKGPHGRKKALKIKEFVSGQTCYEMEPFTSLQAKVIQSLAQALKGMLRAKAGIKKVISEYTKKMFPGIQNHCCELKGMTYFVLGKFLAETGGISNFESDDKLASYAGQAPRIFQSAGMKRTKKSRRHNRELSHLIHMITCMNIRKGFRFHDMYEENKGKYTSKLAAMKPIKRKIVRIVYYMLKSYSEISLNTAKEKENEKLIS